MLRTKNDDTDEQGEILAIRMMPKTDYYDAHTTILIITRRYHEK